MRNSEKLRAFRESPIVNYSLLIESVSYSYKDRASAQIVATVARVFGKEIGYS